jgi:hypothetical protein
MRLPKPLEKGVRHQRRFIGSVYSADQMKAFAEKATELEQKRIIALVLDEIGEDYADLWSTCALHIIDKIKDNKAPGENK